MECLLFYPSFQSLQVTMEEENYGITVDNCLLALENNSNLIIKYLYILLLTLKILLLLLGLMLTHPTPHCVSYQSFC